MRRLAALLLPVGLAITTAGAAPVKAIAASTTSGWHLVFSDGFGTGPLKTGAWTPNWLGAPTDITKPPNSYETAAFDPAQVTFDSYGHLVLTTVNKPWAAPDGTDYRYRSGTITGYQLQGYTAPLKVVARLWLACTSTGAIKNWPSFWLVGDPYHWPQSGEIDVVEGLDGVAAWHAHYVASDGTIQGPGGQVSGDWCGWHTFQVKWWGTTITWLYDSVNVASMTGYAATAPEFPVIMYSTAHTGSSLSQCPRDCAGPTAIGAKMKADYIHIYKWY